MRPLQPGAVKSGGATSPGGDQKDKKKILEIITFSLSLQSQKKEKKKKDLHPLVLTSRTGQTVLKLLLLTPLWLVALFWLFVKCSFLLVHGPLGFKIKRGGRGVFQAEY